MYQPMGVGVTGAEGAGVMGIGAVTEVGMVMGAGDIMVIMGMVRMMGVIFQDMTAMLVAITMRLLSIMVTIIVTITIILPTMLSTMMGANKRSNQKMASLITYKGCLGCSFKAQGRGH